jgi:hypothetical protein
MQTPPLPPDAEKPDDHLAGLTSLFNPEVIRQEQRQLGETEQQQDLIQKIYAAFNARDIPTILAVFDPQVRWSRAWEGDYAVGHEQVRDYWLRQWQELDPHVEPTGFAQRESGQLEVTVQQLVKDLQGHVVFDGLVKHLYTIEEGVIKQMDIEKA